MVYAYLCPSPLFIIHIIIHTLHPCSGDQSESLPASTVGSVGEVEYDPSITSGDQSESLPASTVGSVGEVEYDPSITNYHPINHACWNRGQKYV